MYECLSVVIKVIVKVVLSTLVLVFAWLCVKESSSVRMFSIYVGRAVLSSLFEQLQFFHCKWESRNDLLSLRQMIFIDSQKRETTI